MVGREAALNAVMHGKAMRIDIRINCTRHELEMTVSDDGCGFDPEAAERQNGYHFGLKGMRERVQRSGGKFSLNTAPGKGSCITIRMKRSKQSAS